MTSGAKHQKSLFQSYKIMALGQTRPWKQSVIEPASITDASRVRASRLLTPVASLLDYFYSVPAGLHVTQIPSSRQVRKSRQKNE